METRLLVKEMKTYLYYFRDVVANLSEDIASMKIPYYSPQIVCKCVYTVGTEHEICDIATDDTSSVSSEYQIA